MKIIDKTNDTEELFGNMQVGDCFKTDCGNYYMKIVTINDWNAVNLKSGCLHKLEGWRTFTPVIIEARVISEGKSNG